VSTSGQSGGTGIFARLVSKFLVKWVRRTLDRGSAATPALSPVPGDVAGRPDRDRSRETAGAHRGAGGSRPVGPPPGSTTIAGDDYGAHRGVSAGARPCTSVTYDPSGLEARLAAMWNGDERVARAEALRGADPAVLRRAGMDEHQVGQAADGRVPGGYQMERVPASDAAPSHYQLTPTTAQSQCNCNAVTGQIRSLQIGDVSVISLPIGGTQVTVVLGGAAMVA